MDGTCNGAMSWLMLALLACWWLTVSSTPMGGQLPPTQPSPEAWRAIIDHIEQDLGEAQWTAESVSGEPVFEDAKLLGSDCAWSGSFGYSVAVSGDTVVAGALWDDEKR